MAILKGLLELSYGRSAPADPNQLAYYVTKLRDEPLRPVLASLDKLAQTARSEGEPSFPPLSAVMNELYFQKLKHGILPKSPFQVEQEEFATAKRMHEERYESDAQYRKDCDDQLNSPKGQRVMQIISADDKNRKSKSEMERLA